MSEGLEYTKLDEAIRCNEESAVVLRWKFGRILLAERRAHGTGRQLPNGRLAEVCAAIRRKPREVQYRMKLAEKFETQEEVRNLLRTFDPEEDRVAWTLVIASLTESKPEVEPEPEPEEGEAEPQPEQGSAPAWLPEMEALVAEFPTIRALPTDTSKETVLRAQTVERSLRSRAKQISAAINGMYAAKAEAGQLSMEVTAEAA